MQDLQDKGLYVSVRKVCPKATAKFPHVKHKTVERGQRNTLRILQFKYSVSATWPCLLFHT